MPSWPSPSAELCSLKLRRQLRKDPDSAAAKKRQGEIVTAKGRYMKPQLLDQLSYLARMLDRADQRPGKDAYVRLAELKAWLKRITNE